MTQQIKGYGIFIKTHPLSAAISRRSQDPDTEYILAGLLT